MAKKKGDTPADQCPLKLTQPQRTAILHATGLKPAIRQRIEAAGEGPQTVLVNRKELDELNDGLGSATLSADGPDRKQLLGVLRKVIQLIDAAEDAGPVLVTPAKLVTPDLAFQFKITLIDIRPPIWRRVRVPDCTLGVFHGYIQAAFGWEDCHLHQYVIDGKYYGLPDPDGMDFGMDTADERRVKLSGLLPPSKRKARWVYEYDFGDGWRHEVVFEGRPPHEAGQKDPRCVDGKRACPPEDCGGPWGYGDFLAALADPEHERHDELSEWAGPFDPEAFDAAEATVEMRKVR